MQWYVRFWRLVLFATLLLPGFAQMVLFYFFSPRMLRSIAYGSKVTDWVAPWLTCSRPCIVAKNNIVGQLACW